MSPARKALLVVAGYGVAVLAAWAVVTLYIHGTDTPDRQSSAGMYAFGDTLVFLAAFALAAIPATMLVLYFLRSVPRFWQWAAPAALALAATAVAAMLSYLLRAPGFPDNNWTALAPLRILLAPVLGLGFFLALVFAPTRLSRRLLMAAAAMELVAFVTVVLVWWRSPR
jgi:hypothetical protein